MSIRLSLLAALCAALSAAPGGICAPGSEADSGGGRTMGEMLRALERERELARKELGEGPETGGNAAVLPQNFSDFEIEMDRFAAEREAALAEIAARLAARPKLAVAEPGSPAPEAAGMSDEALKKMKSVLEEEIKKSEADLSLDTLPKAEQFYQAFSSNSAFAIFSKDYEARNLALALAENADKAFAQCFGPGTPFAKPVEIHMLPEGDAEFDGHFLENISRSGDTVISVKCTPALPLDEFCRLLNRAYLRTLALALGGEKAFFSVPKWMQDAFDVSAAAGLSRGVSFEMARRAAKLPPAPPEDVFSGRLPDGANEISAYWTMVAMRAACGQPAKFESLMRRLLVCGGDSAKAAETLRAEFPGARDFGLYWRTALCGEIFARLGGVKRPEDSDAEIRRLCVLAVPREGESPQPVFDAAIFENRDLLQKAIEARIMEIKLELPWTNPAYYNAMVSLGRMFEAAAEGDSGGFEKGRADFLSELRRARDISQRTEKILSAPAH